MLDDMPALRTRRSCSLPLYASPRRETRQGPLVFLESLRKPAAWRSCRERTLPGPDARRRRRELTAAAAQERGRFRAEAEELLGK